MQIGFIGTGNIGAPIAGQLLAAGHELVVHDRRREAAQALLAAGAAWAETPAALAARCEAVATCLPGPPEMEAVCLGPGGLVERLAPGALLLQRQEDRGVARRPAAPHRLVHLRPAELGKAHRRPGLARQLER
ncbi:MAG TPA: NAD(P)-binding domain-containing protein, partial [Stellaceae bacterium]|nr:NAD(P)-binding domain-containing protein [Stellaceae bacterium]